MVEVITAPHNEMLRVIDLGREEGGGQISMVRIRPYPPSLRRIAARTMDPATGASTCALGSQRWVRNIGSFTRNAAFIINHHGVKRNLGIGGVCHGRMSDTWPW